MAKIVPFGTFSRNFTAEKVNCGYYLRAATIEDSVSRGAATI